ncbi:MAG: response regulator [Candidatus Erginobacter occultus]|nr:response regulator [Candidatus Erginobacter occultus]
MFLKTKSGQRRGDLSRRYRVLLVDDDAELVEELAEALEAAGYRVDPFTDAGEALAVAPAQRPDIALIDLKMRVKNGFQLARELLAAEALSGIPIIAMTGYYTRREDEKLMKSSGIRACLFKPFTPEVAARKLDSLLRDKSSD